MLRDTRKIFETLMRDLHRPMVIITGEVGDVDDGVRKGNLYYLFQLASCYGHNITIIDYLLL